MTDRNQDRDRIFSRLTGLHSRDPRAFEEERRRLIRETIDNFPEEYRARANGLQMKIDASLMKYQDPVARMNRMVEIFWEHFQQFHEVLHDPENFLKKREDEKQKNGKVLNFSKK
ncbi:MAG: DUF3135 domain-containing protein [Deltaproteobacteria bacterium]|nr:DUF3135 domain-containing protein [Deltaproteobacteria bacterium]